MFQCKIAHISDIHIKNRSIDFTTLFDKLRYEKPDIIVITGDVIDSVTNINSSIILDIISFLVTLITISPVVMIPGNHDINITDSDFFTSITMNHAILKPPIFNYWRHSGIYNFMNITWTVIAYSEDIPAFTFSIEPNILLFHESLDRLNMDVLKLYTCCMGGHLHTQQIIEPNIGYSGSLFQQNIREDHNGHGFLIWNIKQDKVTINKIEVENIFGFLKVEIENDEDITKYPIPKKIIYYDVYYKNTVNINNIVNKYISIYKTQPRNIKDITIYSNNTTNISDSDIHNIDFQCNLIEQYLGKNHYCLQDIINIHKQYHSTFYQRNETTNEKITLLLLEFENIYSFEGINIVNFNNMSKKLSGIVAKNSSGKSSIIDIILYALYDVHPRISTKNNMININNDSYYVYLEFKINDKIGIIKKKPGVCIFNFDNINYTQKTIPLTLNEIKNTVGSFNNALMISVQLHNSINFISSTPCIRKQKLSEILALNIFDNIENNIKYNENKISSDDSEILLKEYEDTTTNNDKINKKLSKFDSIITDLIIEKNKKYGDMYLRKICKLDRNIKDIDILIDIALLLIEKNNNDRIIKIIKPLIDKPDNNLKLYKQVIRSGNGIISILLNEYRYDMENKVNDLLSDFNLIIKINEDFTIVHKIFDKWIDISSSSSYQKFLLNIVFRLVLWRMSNIIIPDMLVIDEGFGVCDSENIKNITLLLKKIISMENTPSHIIVINHIEYLNNNLDYSIYIENNKISNQDTVVTKKIEIKVNETRFYCNLCDVDIKLVNKNKHLISTKHKNKL